MSAFSQSVLAGGNDLAYPTLYRGGTNAAGGTTNGAPIYTNPIFTRAPAPPSGMPPLPSSLGSPAPAPTPAPTPSPTPAPTPTAAPATPSVTPVTAANALNNFANSAGMKFALQQGANVLNNLYAAHGQIQSGAAAKALQSYGQNTALQSYFFPYMNYLTGQQAMGAQAASAIGGVGSSYGNTVAGMGQNYSNAVTGINAGMGNALSQGAINIGNANANQAIIGGLANAGLGSAIGQGLGQIGSSFFSPSASSPGYGQFNSTIAYNNGALGVNQPYVG